MPQFRRVGTHFEGPIMGSGRAVGGLCRDVPIDIVNRRDGVAWFNDFIKLSDFGSEWTETDIGAAAATTVIIEADARYGVLHVNAGTTSSTGVQAQFTGAEGAGEFLDFGNADLDDVEFAMEIRFKVDTVANGAAAVGLANTDTTVLTTGGALDVTDGILFHMADGGALTLRTSRDSQNNDTATLLTMADDTYVTMGFKGWSADVSSDTASQLVQVYNNGSLVATVTDATDGVVPITGVCPSFAAVNDAANDIDLRIDYFWVWIQRDTL